MSTHPLPADSDRFTVSYTLSGDEREAMIKARDICYEQTVEFPEDLTPSGFIKDVIVGKIEEFGPPEAGPGTLGGGECYRADISFAAQTVGTELTQLLNVIFGNISLKAGIRVEKLRLPDGMLRHFRGPRFGQQGLRALTGVENRPLICTALKPMGLSPERLAEQAYAFAQGGIDIIKDDHGLADQPFCPFEERVSRCAQAVAEANRETGGSSLYMPNITAPADRLAARARLARDCGAGALLVMPGLTGADHMRLLADDDSLNLPLVSHPAFWGGFTSCPQNGLSPFFLYGQLMRLAGADAVVFPHYGGRFPFSREDCVSIAEGCAAVMGDLSSSLPVPGGGVTGERLRDMHNVYGREFMLLIGGELHRGGPDLAENCRVFVKMLEKMQGVTD
jgi:ribulose-bisphosphate carboxylase large chain